MYANPLTDAELDFIDRVLGDYGNDHAVLDCSELDGFLTAIASAPEAIAPAEWLPALWGDASAQPRWRSEEERQYFTGLLIQHLNHITTTLREQPDNFEAIYQEREIEGLYYTVVEAWCFGYIRGVCLRADTWATLPPAAIGHLSCIYLFGSEPHFDSLEALSQHTVQMLQERIEPAARALHAHWLAQRASPMPAEPDVRLAHFAQDVDIEERDLLCPCGSGRPYHKCCGLH